MFGRILTHSRPAAASRSPSTVSGPPETLRREPGGCPTFPSCLPQSGSAVLRLWDSAGLPRLCGGCEGDGPRWHLSARHSWEQRFGGASHPPLEPTLSPQIETATPAQTPHKARRARELRPSSPLRSPHPRWFPSPSSLAGPSFSFLRLQPHPGPLDPGRCGRVGGGPR